MAVAPKQRKNSVTYYVATLCDGRQHWERSGTDKREAERLDRQRKAEVKAGTFRPKQRKARPTVAEYIATWGKARTNTSAGDDRRNLARYATLLEFTALRLDDVRPRHVIAATRALLDAGTVSAKTVANAYGTLTTMFRDAVIEELTAATPCVFPSGFWPDDEAEEREPYTREEAAILISSPHIPEPIRVLNAFCLLGGFREGEACGRRWADLDTGPAPLAALDVRTQYDGLKLKTRRPRVVPVHPELLSMLEQWAKAGFARLTGRPPTPDDFIVPHVSRRSHKGHHTRSTYYKAFVRGALAAGVAPHTLHSTRHTMITLALRGGAIKPVLSRVTHNAKGDIVDRYTHRDWAELCDAVLAIGSLFDARPTPRLTPGNAGNSGGAGDPMNNTEDREKPSNAGAGPGFNSRRLHQETPTKKLPRQTKRQTSSAIVSDHPDDGQAFADAVAEAAERGRAGAIRSAPWRDPSLPAVVRVVLLERARAAA